MLVMIALLYIMLCIRLRVHLEANFSDGKGSAMVAIGAYGIYFRRRYALVRGKHAFALRVVPQHKRKKKASKASSASEFMARFIRSYALNALRGGRFDHLMIHAQLGLGDACETAIAAGALHALVSALLAAAGNRRVCELRIVPEFSRVCLHMHLQGIFSCQLGDIMLAALEQARRKRKEGLKWTSIPLRA